MTTSATSGKRIVIVGAGPGGLTCARILQRHGIAVTVYDGDEDAAARNQGGSLDLHEEDGQLALREAGLLDEFFELARFEGQEMRQLDPLTGAVLDQHLPEVGETSAPEIDRGQLRTMLLASLEPGTVQWSRRLDGVSGPDAGPRTLTFRDGTTVAADLVIGADGAWSRVRKAISSASPVYSGVDFLEAWFEDVESSHPGLVELVGQGSAMAGDAEGAMFAQRNSGDHMRVYLVRRRPVDWMAQHGLSIDEPDGIREHVAAEFAGWAPELLQLATSADAGFVDRPLFVLPEPHSWEHSPSVTLLGDAAHLVPPVGVGVNFAMLDGCELALALAGAETLDEAVVRYESTMLPRSIALAVSLEGKADFLLDDGEGRPEDLADALGSDR